MSYGMTFTDAITDKDKVLQGDGYKLVVDAFALSYLKGCDIDFVEQGLNASFVFNNVFQAVGGSGGCSACGSSGGGCA
jgi:iron-sulfur cluster insertion protein